MRLSLTFLMLVRLTATSFSPDSTGVTLGIAHHGILGYLREPGTVRFKDSAYVTVQPLNLKTITSLLNKPIQLFESQR